MELTGRTVMVTGASSGLGRDAAILLSELGANIVLVARHEGRLKEAHDQLAPGTHTIIPFDVTQHEQTLEWMVEAVRTTGPLYGLVHSAGINKRTLDVLHELLRETRALIDSAQNHAEESEDSEHELCGIFQEAKNGTPAGPTDRAGW